MRYRALFGALLAVIVFAATADHAMAQTGQMSMPENHQAFDFLATHGRQAKADVTLCAVCHARDYCAACHVNAYDVPAIQALEPNPDVAEYVAGKEWSPPANHTITFLEDHRAAAAGQTATCAVCHNVEQRCLSCHLGSETLERAAMAQQRRDIDLYHPLNFMSQHNAAAWNRENECASCHNTVVFCQSCHTSLGYAEMNQPPRSDTGFHNKDSRFQFGHGQAARQGLESCAACHAQTDCLACHSAKTGRNINPHGPTFDASRIAKKNETFCLFCHWSVPGGGP